MDFLGNLPDWVQVVVAFGGVFAGGAGGTTYGAVLLQRAEGRRRLDELLRQFILEMNRAFMSGTKAPLDKVLVIPDTSDLHYQCAEIVSKLPWHDRSEWTLFRHELNDLRDPGLAVDFPTFHDALAPTVRRGQALVLQLGDYLNPSLLSRPRRWWRKAVLIAKGFGPFCKEVRMLRNERSIPFDGGMSTLLYPVWDRSVRNDPPIINQDI